MEFTIFYAIAAVFLLGTLFLIRIRSFFANLLKVFSFLATKHFTYPYLWGRHRLIGPCTRADALSYVAYAVTNVVFIAFDNPPTATARNRAGTMSLINMNFLFLAHNLEFLANAMGVSLKTCKRIHRAAGWMTGILLSLHIIMTMILERNRWSLRETSNLSALIVCLTSYSFQS